MRRFVRDAAVASGVSAVAHWVAYHAVTWAAEGEPLEPSRFMASVVLGQAAFDPGRTSAGAALGWGWVGHLLVSVPWSVLITAVAHSRPAWFALPGRAGVVAGLVVWVVSVYGLAPLLGMGWLAEQDVPTMATVHVVFGVANALALRPRT